VGEIINLIFDYRKNFFKKNFLSPKKKNVWDFHDGKTYFGTRWWHPGYFIFPNSSSLKPNSLSVILEELEELEESKDSISLETTLEEHFNYKIFGNNNIINYSDNFYRWLDFNSYYSKYTLHPAGYGKYEFISFNNINYNQSSNVYIFIEQYFSLIDLNLTPLMYIYLLI
jgi:hypothetical protein